MRYISLLFILILTITSCVKKENIKLEPISAHYWVYIDKRFDEQDKYEINNALYSWEFNTNYLIEFEETDYPLKSNLIIEKSNSTDKIIVLYNNVFKSDNLVGLFLNIKPAKIYIVKDNLLTGIYPTTLHEVGHFLGLKDNTNKNSIMNGNLFLGSKRITKDDINELCEKFDCKDLK